MKRALEADNIVVDGDLCDIDASIYDTDDTPVSPSNGDNTRMSDNRKLDFSQNDALSFWGPLAQRGDDEYADLSSSSDEDELLTATELLLRRQKGHHDLMAHIAGKENNGNNGNGWILEQNDIECTQSDSEVEVVQKNWINDDVSFAKSAKDAMPDIADAMEQSSKDIPKHVESECATTSKMCSNYGSHGDVLDNVDSRGHGEPNDLSIAQKLSNVSLQIEDTSRNHCDKNVDLRQDGEMIDSIITKSDVSSNDSKSSEFKHYIDPSSQSASEIMTPLIAQPQEIRKLNLDITTLISYISNLCHGHCNYVFQVIGLLHYPHV